MLGKTNTHELGGGVTTINPFFGTTRNPHDPDRIAGGSSGGSAAAVADRLAVAATGTDTGGSIRIPAALCGCVGFKPTFGLLSTAGVLGAVPSFDHAGFLARSVADLGPLLGATVGVEYVMAGAIPASAATNGRDGLLRGVRVGVPRAYFFSDLDDTVGRAMETALGRLERAGAHVRDVRPPVDGTTMARVFDPIVVEEIHRTYDRDWHERPNLFSGAFAEFFRQPRPTPTELERARRALEAFRAGMAGLFDDVEVLALPAVPIVAPRIDGPIDGMRILRNTWPFNASRSPALTLPCGPPGQLPVGLQLVARPHQDARLVQVGALVEMAQ
jgi:aspartyl-tRNA(Asn)/glutamyl-tRNA(Gln) amidotransferase subunit A